MGIRRRVLGSDLHEFEQYRALLAALSDDLALPLLQIRTSLEILENSPVNEETAKQYVHSMALSTEAGLQLVEAYRLALRVKNKSNLTMEPVAIGAVLQDVAHNMLPYAKQYATDLEVDIQGKLTPVLAHRPSLTAALECLSASMIRAQAAASHHRRYRLILGAHRSANNVISTGVFSNVKGLSDKTLQNAHSLVGQAHQPLSSLPSGAASGVLIADILCASMWQPLRAAAHRRMGGLATSVPISKQMQFI